MDKSEIAFGETGLDYHYEYKEHLIRKKLKSEAGVCVITGEGRVLGAMRLKAEEKL